MSVILLPRIASWSLSIFVIMETIGLPTFVASSLPPSPTSITAISTFSSAKYRNAIAVVNSKKVRAHGSRGMGESGNRGFCFVVSPFLHFSVSPLRCFILFTNSATFLSVISLPFIRILSLNLTRCGDV